MEVEDVAPEASGGACECERGYFGVGCERTARVVSSKTTTISSAAAAAGTTTTLSVGAGQALSFPAAAIPASMLPLDVSFDLIDEVSLPPDMLPSRTDPFVPAGSFADFRPDGHQFAAAVEVTLSFHTPASGS